MGIFSRKPKLPPAVEAYGDYRKVQIPLAVESPPVKREKATLAKIRTKMQELKTLLYNPGKAHVTGDARQQLTRKILANGGDLPATGEVVAATPDPAILHKQLEGVTDAEHLQTVILQNEIEKASRELGASYRDQVTRSAQEDARAIVTMVMRFHNQRHLTEALRHASCGEFGVNGYGLPGQLGFLPRNWEDALEDSIRAGFITVTWLHEETRIGDSEEPEIRAVYERLVKLQRELDPTFRAQEAAKRQAVLDEEKRKREAEAELRRTAPEREKAARAAAEQEEAASRQRAMESEIAARFDDANWETNPVAK